MCDLLSRFLGDYIRGCTLGVPMLRGPAPGGESYDFAIIFLKGVFQGTSYTCALKCRALVTKRRSLLEHSTRTCCIGLDCAICMLLSAAW